MPSSVSSITTTRYQAPVQSTSRTIAIPVARAVEWRPEEIPLPDSPIEPSSEDLDTPMTERRAIVTAQGLRVQTGDLHPEDIPLPPSPLERPIGEPNHLTFDVDEPELVTTLATRPESIPLPESEPVTAVSVLLNVTINIFLIRLTAVTFSVDKVTWRRRKFPSCPLAVYFPSQINCQDPIESCSTQTL